MNRYDRVVMLYLGVFLMLLGPVLGANTILTLGPSGGFLPLPPFSPAFESVLQGLLKAEFVFPTVIIVEFVVGCALVFNKQVSVALVLLAPILVGILLSHLAALDILGLLPGVVVVCGWLYLVWGRRERFKLMVD